MLDNIWMEGKPISKANDFIDSYLLRRIPKNLWTRANHRAVDEDISLRELLLRALEAYLRRGGHDEA
jgi:hypothetical protein